MGRAGRKEDTGKVYIQTRKPDHIVLKYAIKNDYINFFNNQLQERKMFKYPPFYRLILFSVKHKDPKKANQSAIKLKLLFSKIEGLIILGPEEPVYGRVKLYYIRNILIKIPRNNRHTNTRLKLQTIVENFLAEKDQSGVKIIADADNI
jgi:primosomal protein N' (replication factor Y)